MYHQKKSLPAIRVRPCAWCDWLADSDVVRQGVFSCEGSSGELVRRSIISVIAVGASVVWNEVAEVVALFNCCKCLGGAGDNCDCETDLWRGSCGRPEGLELGFGFGFLLELSPLSIATTSHSKRETSWLQRVFPCPCFDISKCHGKL